MKKILMGLAAISTISFGAITLDIPGDMTNVFIPAEAQSGKITMQGRLTSQPEKVKYVVFASETGNWDGTQEDVWKLPDFEITMVKSTGGFISNPTKKVYVKKLNSLDEVQNLTSETVTFNILVDSNYTGLTVATNLSLNLNDSVALEPTQLFSTAELKAFVSSLNNPDFQADVTNYGVIAGFSHIFRPAKSFKFNHQANGVLIAESADTVSFEKGDSMTADEAQPILAALATPLPFNTAAVQVVVK